MAKAKKLPSGSWRCLVYSHTEKVLDPKTGQMKDKRVYESFTDDDPGPRGKRRCEAAAAAWAASTDRGEKRMDITFGEAVDKYISDRDAVLSASTVREYKRMRRVDLKDLEDIKIGKVDAARIQQLVNQKAQRCSPKTVRNIHGLISAVLKAYRPEMVLRTALPQKVRPALHIPGDEEIKVLLSRIDDEDMMISVLLSAFGPLRRSEICGLEDGDIKGNVAHIHRAVVLNEDNEWVDKTTKSFAGDRYVPLPDFVCDRLRGRKGRIVQLKPNQISDRFIDLVKVAGLEHFRFHDLRHYCASIQHAIGIPDVYIMQRGGWGSDAVLKQVYRHALEDRSGPMSAKANNYFSELCNTKCNTNVKNP